MTRRGFASITSLTLLALVAAATVALADRFADDVRQTHDHAIDTQLRQLLAAAAMAVEQGDTEIALPPDLVDDFTVRIDEVIEDDHRTATIRATGPHQTQRQVLTWTRRDGRWRLDQAQLNPSMVRSQPVRGMNH
jgi:hypothetical protein